MGQWNCLILLILLSFLEVKAIVPPQEQVRVPRGTIGERRARNMKKYAPTNLKPGATSYEVQTRVLDHSVAGFVKDKMKEMDSGLLAKAQKLNKVSGTFKLTTDGAERIETAVAHEFTVNMQAFSQLANINYKGYFNARLEYQLGGEFTKFELKRDIFNDTQFVFNHSSDRENHLNQLLLRWDWD